MDADGDPIPGAVISRLGRAYAITGSDGTFAFDHAYGTFDFDVLLGTKVLGTLEDVTVTAGAVTGLADVHVTSPAGTDYMPLVILLAAIVGVLAGYILIGMLRGRTPPEKSEGSGEGEE